MDTKTLTPAALLTIEVDLPKTLISALAEIARRDGRSQDDVMRTALEVYAERVAAKREVSVVAGLHEAREPLATTRPPQSGMVDTSDDESVAKHGARRFASLGVGESADDGFDSTNHEEWLKKNWRPD